MVLQSGLCSGYEVGELRLRAQDFQCSCESNLREVFLLVVGKYHSCGSLNLRWFSALRVRCKDRFNAQGPWQQFIPRPRGRLRLILNTRVLVDSHRNNEDEMTSVFRRVCISVLGLVSLVMDSSASADCDPDIIEQQLKKGAWTYDANGQDSDGDNVFRIVREGKIGVLYAERDGDSMFISYFSDGHERSDSNEVYKQFRYLKAYSDDEGDVVLAIDVAK